MNKERLAAFSDGVIAIIITIMVLELHIPHGDSLASLGNLAPVFISYILSFINVGIYWNNHHHLIQVIERVNGKALWANLHLLFWLSLIPFCTAWMGENHFTKWPVILYGIVLLMSGVGYYILEQVLVYLHGPSSTIGKVIGRDKKGIFSVVFYVTGIGLCFISPWLGILMDAIVAVMWLIPDKRIENNVDKYKEDKN